MSEEENSGDENNESEEKEEENEENEENEDDEEKVGEKADEEEKEEKEEDEEKEEKEDDNKEKDLPEKKKQKKGKEVKGINKFLSTTLHQSNEIKLDLKGRSNSKGFLGNLLNNNNFITNEFSINYSLKALSDINNDMDLLSYKINKDIIPKYSINSYNDKKLENINYRSPLINNDYNYYDKEDFEIKQLINKSKEILNILNIRNNGDFKFKYNKTKKYVNLENGENKYKNTFSQYSNKSLNSSKFSTHFYKKNNYDNNNINYKTISNLDKNYNFNRINNEHDNINNHRRILEFGKNSFNNNYNFKNNNVDTIDFDKEIDSEYYNAENFKNGERYYSNKNRIINHKKKYYINNRKFSENNFLARNSDNNIVFNTLQNINQRNRLNDSKVTNKLKNSQSLYQKTFSPKRKLIIYTQPNSIPKTNSYLIRKKNGIKLPIMNNYKEYDYYDNNSKSHRFLRYSTDGVNRAMNILLGNG